MAEKTKRPASTGRRGSQQRAQKQLANVFAKGLTELTHAATLPARTTPRRPPKATVPTSVSKNLFASAPARSPTLTPKSSTERATPSPKPAYRTYPTPAPSARGGGDVGAVLHHAAGVAESVLPMEHGHVAWAKPEILKRTSALKDTAAVGIIKGSEWAAHALAHKIAHDHRRAGYIQDVIHQEAVKKRPLTVSETNHLAAGYGVDPNEVGPLKVQHFKNLAAGLAGITVGAVTDPVGVAKDIGKLAVGIPVGTGLLVAAMSRPDLNAEDRAKMLAAMPKGIQDEYKKHFGSGLSAEQAFERAKEDPINTALLYPLPVGAAAQATRVAWLLKSGKGLRESVRLARDPEVQRMLTYTERGTEGAEAVKTQVPTFWSSSVLWRNAAQRPYDVISKGLEAVPGARRLPIAEGKRALRAQAKAVRRTKTRRGAEAHAAFREVQSFINHRNALGQKVNAHYATTIAALVQKPDGFTDAEWEQAIIQNLKDMRADPENLTLPGDEVSPAEQRIINRINRYDRRAQAERVRKKGLAVRRLHNEQRRLGENLSRIVSEQEGMYEKYISLTENPDLMPKAKADLTAQYDGEMKALRSEADVMRQRLGEISVDQTPIESANRAQLRDTLERLPYFQDNPQAIEDALLAGDAVARHWGKQKGLDPAEWWNRRHIGGVTPAEDIPLEAYAQTRPVPATPLKPTPADELTNRNRAVQVRAARRGQTHYTRKMPDGSLKSWKVDPRAHQKWANEPTVDAQGRPLFGQEVPYDVVMQRWEEGFRRTHPDATDEQIQAEMLKAATFYDDLFPYFGRIMHDREVLSWLTSQKGASPAFGLGALAKIIERAMIRQKIGPRDIGLASQTMARVLYGETGLAEGAAAKLTDFTDLGTAQTATRTYAGHDPAAGSPYPGDRWEGRGGPGYVDDSYLETLYREHDAALQAQGYISRDEWEQLRRNAQEETRQWAAARTAKGNEPTLQERNTQNAKNLRAQEAAWEKQNPDRKVIKTDYGSGPGSNHYEHISDYGNGLIDHLNAYDQNRGYLGKSDWNTSTGQALNWAGIQHSLGVVPENIDTALFSMERGVGFEIEGVGRLAEKFPGFKDLTEEQRFALTKHVADIAIDRAAEKSGVIVVRSTVGYGGWDRGINPSIRVGVIAADRSFGAFVDNLRDLVDEAEVWGFHGNSKASHRALAVEHDQLRDPNVLLEVWNELVDAHPEFQGFTHIPGGGFDSMLSNADGTAFKVTKEFQDAVNATLEKINQRFDGELNASFHAVDPIISTRERSALSGQVERDLGQARSPAELRRRRADSRSAEKSLRVGDKERADVEARIADGLDRIKRGEPLDELSGRIYDPNAQPPFERITETRTLRSRRLPPDAAGKAQGYDLYFQRRNQSRRSDTLGATQLLNSATGERVIWLTEHADFSTVIHELLGHAADEMKDLHPEEFAQVEQVMGKPLDDWAVADHEKFATWFERYLAEGHAPTPELVPVFDRAKQYMRVIYEQMRRLLGGRIPPATRDLFDHYLGGWDSDSATRIAVNMGHYGPGEDIYSGARVAAQKELETLQKRNRTRRYNRSIPGMLDELKRLERDAEKRGTLNQEERDALASKIVRLRAEIVIRSDKRVRSLDSKIADMEKALSRDLNNRRFSGALQAAKWMMDDRTRILKEAFGEEFDPIFDNREDLLANYLVQHGLLSPDFEHGTGSYFPMKLDEGFWQTMKEKVPMVPASNRVVGQVSKAMVGVHHKNEMIRWQAGDWSADPMVLHLAHARASSYQFVLELRELLHSMGRKLSFDEEHGNFPNGGYLINLKGTPLSHDLRLQTRGMTHTTTADHIDEGLFGDDNKLEASLKDFFDNSVIDIDNLPAGLDLADENLRFISKDAVNTIFRPVNLNWGGKVWDAGTTAARFALIYANAPGYMITNLAGNLVFLTGQSGLNWIPRTAAYAKMLANDRYLRERIQAEGGMVPALASITRGRNFQQQIGQAATKVEQKWLQGLSVVDEYPRMIAWLTEANKAGYYRKDDLIRLLDGKTPKTERDRERVAEYTNQHMIDFTHRVSDRERQTLGRLFFIWPYVRGATALPFWYGKNYPARSALIAQLALQQRAYQQSILGPLPPGREDLYPIGRRGQQAVVLGSRYYNPTGPLADEVRLGEDLVASAFGRTPDNLSQRLSSLLNVNVEGLMTVATGRDAFGRDVSLKKSVTGPYGIADSLIPFLRYVRAFNSDKYVPRAFREGEGNTFQERFFRNVIRINPQTVSVNWLNAQAQSTGAKTTTEKIDQAVTANQKHFHAIEGAKTHYPNTLRKQVAAKVIFDDRVYALERDQAAKAAFIPKQRDDGSWDFGYHADNYDKAMVAHAILKQNMPEVLAQHPTFAQSPNEYLAAHGAPPRSVKGEDLADAYVQFFNDMISKPPGEQGIMPAHEYDVEYADIQMRKKYFGEKKRGVYGR